ncbi:MAG: protein kinase [Myxococcales bacterium]|nr:protein kinase [Myxococcales bacterium]
MADERDPIDDTIQMRLATLAPYAETMVANPRSTIEPPRPDSDDQSRAALHGFEVLGDELRRHARQGLEVERTIGEGGMGVVRLATQVALGRKVAVKSLKDEARGRTATLELLREAWVTGGLEHPNIVPVYDVGMDDRGGPLIVLKRIEGVSWGEVMHDAAAIEARFSATDPLEWNLRTLVTVCNAVAFAHSRGIVHRDLKPENVMLGQFGEVYVLDWGIAVTTEPSDERLPQARDANEMAGTPCYMAPEMLGGAADKIGPRSDVYLLGAILYEILTGKVPHDGPNLQAILASVIVSDIGLPKDVPAEIAAVCRQAMAREPEDRHDGAESFREDVEAFLRHRNSRQLTRTADESRAHLREARAGGASTEDLYDLLGECRFGYRAALAAWEDNTAARAGLVGVLVEMAEYELSIGEPHAAAHLLAECPEKPGELAARIAEATVKVEAERKKLEQLHQDHDATVGRRTRVFLMAIMGSMWVGGPTWLHFHHETGTYGRTLVVTVAFLLIAIGLGIWARESMGKTLVNRRLGATVVFVLVSQIALEVGGMLGGLSVREIHATFPSLWATGIGMVALWLEPKFAPTAIAGFALVIVARAFPRWMYLDYALFNFILAVNVIVVWFPREDIEAAREDLRQGRRPRWRRGTPPR